MAATTAAKLEDVTVASTAAMKVAQLVDQSEN